MASAKARGTSWVRRDSERERQAKGATVGIGGSREANRRARQAARAGSGAERRPYLDPPCVRLYDDNQCDAREPT